MARPLIVLGAGTYASVVTELAASCGFETMRYLDDSQELDGTDLEGIPVQSPILTHLPDKAEISPETAFAVAIGSNPARLAWLQLLQKRQLDIPTLISPLAYISPTASIADGCIIHHNSSVWTGAAIGLGTILSPHATVAHHTSLAEGCFVSSAANVGASIEVSECAMFGMGSTTSTGVKTIAPHSLIGAGATVVRDTEAYGVYAGTPARLLRKATATSRARSSHQSLSSDN